MQGGADQWFVQAGGVQRGPLRLETLRGLVASGALRSNDLVWRKGFSGWVKAERALPSLFTASAHGGSRPNPGSQRRHRSGCLPRMLVLGILVAAGALLIQRLGWNTLRLNVTEAAEGAAKWARQQASQWKERDRARQIETTLDMRENAPLREFLSSPHELVFPQPAPRNHVHAWTDDRSQRLRDGCGFTDFFDPQIPSVRARLEATLDLGAVQAIEHHFGSPDPLPTVWSRSDLMEGDREVHTRFTHALSLHGVRLESRHLGSDHAWLIRTSVPVLQDVARAAIRSFPRIENQGDRARDVVALVSLVQCVPYVSVQNRPGWENYGLHTPGRTLLEGGDCDSKSLLLATLLRAVRPDLPVVLIEDMQRGTSVQPEPHMLIGLGIPARPCDRTVLHGGRRYVLVETTHIWQIGEVPKDFDERTIFNIEDVP